jgi:hypothetical protein
MSAQADGRRRRVKNLDAMSDELVTKIAGICIFAIAINATLIQTIATEDSPLKTVVRVGVMGLAALAILLRFVPLKRWVVLTVLLSTTLLLASKNPDQLSYIFVFVVVTLLGEVDPRRLLRIAVIASATSLALVFVFLATGITQDSIMILRGRHTFGTASVPYLMNVIYGTGALLALYVAKYQPKRGKVGCVAFLAFATLIFARTDARGGYYALLIFLALLVIVPRVARMPTARLLVAGAPLLIMSLAFVVASRAGDEGWNLFLSNRPRQYGNFLDRVSTWHYLVSESVQQYDAGIISRSIYAQQIQIKQSTIVDNSYLHLLVGGGVVLAAVFFVAYALAIAELFRSARYPEIAFMTATVCYFGSESLLVRVEHIFVIFFWYLLVANARRAETVRSQPETSVR